MIALAYFPTIEATEEPDYFSFYSADLEGFTGSGHSVEDCLDQALRGMGEHVDLPIERGLPVPPRSVDPEVTLRNDRQGAAA